MSGDNMNMSPEVSPNTETTGVKRVNRMPIYVVIAVAMAFASMMGAVAYDRVHHEQVVDQPDKDTSSSNMNSMTYAKGITSGYQDGVIPASSSPSATPSQPRTVKAHLSPPNNTSSVVHHNELHRPRQSSGYGGGSQVVNPEEQRIRMMKLQMFEQAVKASSKVQGGSGGYGGGSTMIGSSQPATRQQMINEIDRVNQQIAQNSAQGVQHAHYQAGLGQGSSGGGSSSDAAPTLLNATPSSASGANKWQLNSHPQAPATPYVLRAGFVLPAVLDAGINSELPGVIEAHVSQGVYDTATGRYLLVPQGTKLYGSYESHVSYGQARVFAVWKRLVFPDGKAMDIGEMPGADSQGYSGFQDQVNNHYWRIFSSAFLMSGITAGITLSQDNNNQNTNAPTASTALSEALGQQLGNVAVEMIRKNMNISPTLTIRPGYRFNVMVTKDMVFSKPYQSFDYK